MTLSVKKLKLNLFSIYEFPENDKEKALLFLWPWTKLQLRVDH